MVWLSIAATLETHFNLSNSEQLWYLHLRSKTVTMYTSTALTCRCLRIYTWNIVNQPCQISKLGHFKDSKWSRHKIENKKAVLRIRIRDLGTTTTFRVIFPPFTAGNVDIACLMLVSTAPCQSWFVGVVENGMPAFAVHLGSSSISG